MRNNQYSFPFKIELTGKITKATSCAAAKKTHTSAHSHTHTPPKKTVIPHNPVKDTLGFSYSQQIQKQQRRLLRFPGKKEHEMIL